MDAVAIQLKIRLHEFEIEKSKIEEEEWMGKQIRQTSVQYSTVKHRTYSVTWMIAIVNRRAQSCTFNQQRHDESNVKYRKEYHQSRWCMIRKAYDAREEGREGREGRKEGSRRRDHLGWFAS